MAKVVKDGISYTVRDAQISAFLASGWKLEAEESASPAPKAAVEEAQAPVEKPKPKRRTKKA